MRVGLADDSELFRTGLAALLEASGIQVVLQVASGRDLLARVAVYRLDAVVIDLRMPPTHTDEGLDAADELGVSHPALAVLVLSTYAETAYAVRLFQRGAARRGYLLKDALDHPLALRDALERLVRGGTVLDRSIGQRLMGGSRLKDVLARLSGQQRSVLDLLAQGYNDADIAVALDLEPAATRVIVNGVLDAIGLLPDDESTRLNDVLAWLRA